MKYKVIFKGEFENVKHISVEQTFEIKVQCVACREQSEKPIILTADSSVRKEVGIFNLLYSCHGCKRQLSAKVNIPKEKKMTLLNTSNNTEEEVGLFLGEMQGLNYKVSEIVLGGCELIGLKVLLMNIVDNKDNLYSEVKLNYEEKCWTGDFKNSFSSIVNYSIEYELSK